MGTIGTDYLDSIDLYFHLYRSGPAGFCSHVAVVSEPDGLAADLDGRCGTHAFHPRLNYQQYEADHDRR